MEPIRCCYSSCDKVYKSKFNLNRHINSFHLKQKNFKCELCFKLFVSKQNLRDHLYIHTGEKPFPCPEVGCKKRFRQASQLAVHSKMHARRSFHSKNRQDFRSLLLTMCLRPFQKPEYPQLSTPLEDAQPLPAYQPDENRPNLKLPVLPILLKYI